MHASALYQIQGPHAYAHSQHPQHVVTHTVCRPPHVRRLPPPSLPSSIPPSFLMCYTTRRRLRACGSRRWRGLGGCLCCYAALLPRLRLLQCVACALQRAPDMPSTTCPHTRRLYLHTCRLYLRAWRRSRAAAAAAVQVRVAGAAAVEAGTDTLRATKGKIQAPVLARARQATWADATTSRAVAGRRRKEEAKEEAKRRRMGGQLD